MEAIAFVAFIGLLLALLLTRSGQEFDEKYTRTHYELGRTMSLSVAQLVERERVQREIERGRRALARERAQAKKAKVGAKAKSGTKGKPKAAPKAKAKAKR